MGKALGELQQEGLRAGQADGPDQRKAREVTPAGETRIRCAAKINLFLAVLGRRPDGFHEIETLFQPVGLYDDVVVRRSERGVELSGDDPGVAWDESNLCWKAASLILAEAEADFGVSIEVSKSIPAGAGLGGGSSDAAGVLAGIERLLGLDLGRERLMEIGLEVGSDVPFFLSGGPAVGRGRGEILEAVEGLVRGWIVIVKPNIMISTRWAYSNLDFMLTRHESANKLRYLLKGLRDLPDAAVETCNSFEAAVIAKHPEIAEILSLMRGEGPALAMMSGSGSACYAITGNESKAMRIRELAADRGWLSVVARPVRRPLVLLQEG